MIFLDVAALMLLVEAGTLRWSFSFSFWMIRLSAVEETCKVFILNVLSGSVGYLGSCFVF